MFRLQVKIGDTQYLRKGALVRPNQRAYDRTPFSPRHGRRAEKPAVVQRIRDGATPSLERDVQFAHLL